MKATVTIDLSDPMALKFFEFAKTLPFIEEGSTQNAKRTPPCQYTVEELREQIDLSMEDYRATGVALTMEEMRAKHPRI